MKDEPSSISGTGPELKDSKNPLKNTFSDDEALQYPLGDSERGQLVVCLKQLIYYVDRQHGRIDLAHEFNKGYFRKLSTGEILQSFHDTGLEFPIQESKALLYGIFTDASSKLEHTIGLSQEDKNLRFILEVKKGLLTHFLGKKFELFNMVNDILDDVKGRAGGLTGEQAIDLIRSKMLEKLGEPRKNEVDLGQILSTDENAD